MMLLTLFLGFAALLRVNNACVVPQGISDSEDSGLDLAMMQDAPSMDLFDFANPLVATVGACTGGLETPISMRALLGKTRLGRCGAIFLCIWCATYRVRTSNALTSVIFAS